MVVVLVVVPRRVRQPIVIVGACIGVALRYDVQVRKRKDDPRNNANDGLGRHESSATAGAVSIGRWPSGEGEAGGGVG